MDLANRVSESASSPKKAWLWLAAGALSMGTGIWSMLQTTSDAQSVFLASVNQETRAATSGVLNGIAVATRHRDRDELDRGVARLLVQFLEARSVTLLRLIDDGHIKRVEQRVRLNMQDRENAPIAANALPELPALADFPIWERCVRQGEVVQCGGTERQMTTAFPIPGEQEVAGILAIETVNPLSQREVDLVGGVLGIVRNHRALLDYGELDALTGLRNRKTFEHEFDKLRHRLALAQPDPPAADRRVAEPSWLALIDIDHFKSINDGYGHLFGDEVLLLVSQLMQRSFRGADQLFRFGGEEFVVLLEHANEPGAHIALEHLRIAIEKYSFPQVGHVTISAGYTRVNPQDVPALCVERADTALYYAKKHGRNNVRCYEALDAKGEIGSKSKVGDIELL
jgi:diguanylate cyclase (GGDEF)-like protein